MIDLDVLAVFWDYFSTPVFAIFEFDDTVTAVIGSSLIALCVFETVKGVLRVCM